MALYFALGIPVFVLMVLGASTAHTVLSLVTLAVFAVADFGVLRKA
jgi:hypothetical protein